MSLKETKFYFEDLFNKEWDCTPIHFVGSEFDGSEHEKWINIVYKPLGGSHDNLGNSAYKSMNQLYIVCWAENDVQGMDLADDVVTFVDEHVDASLYRQRGYDVIDHGFDESNKVFLLLSFTFEQRIGTC